MSLTVSTSIPRTGSRAPFLSVKVGGLSPPTFESGGAQAPPAPPISPPLHYDARSRSAILCVVPTHVLRLYGTDNLRTRVSHDRMQVLKIVPYIIDSRGGKGIGNGRT